MSLPHAIFSYGWRGAMTAGESAICDTIQEGAGRFDQIEIYAAHASPHWSTRLSFLFGLSDAWRSFLHKWETGQQGLWRAMTVPIRCLISRRYSSSSPDVAKTVGFIGLGNMGGHMAKNLIKAGYDVLVYDSDPRRLGGFKQTVGDLGTLSKLCSRIITMLPNDSVVEQVYLGPKGLLRGASRGSVFLDCSTVSPGVERRVAEGCSAQGVTFLDAPVSGGVGGAEKGTLTFLVGGPEPAVVANKDLLEAMGKRILNCGPVGSGQIAKICNNMILGVSMVALAEALNLGARLGLDPKTLAAVINSSSGRSWSSELYNPVPGIMQDTPASREYRGGFMAKLMLKDMLLAAGEAQKTGAPTPTGDAAREMYQRMSEDGRGLAEKDFSAVYELLKSLSTTK